MKIEKLDSTALKNLREPIEKELKALGERLGLTFDIGNGKYGDGAEAEFKLIIKVDDPKVLEAAARAEWDRNCRYIGLNYSDPENTGLRPDDFGTEFESGADTFRTVGIATKGRGSQKFPIKAELVKAGPRTKHAPGTILLLSELVVPKIRAATDAKVKA